jgi:hypothetical protein
MRLAREAAQQRCGRVPYPGTVDNMGQDNHGIPSGAHFNERGKQGVNLGYRPAKNLPRVRRNPAMHLRQPFAVASLPSRHYMRDQ